MNEEWMDEWGYLNKLGLWDTWGMLEWKETGEAMLEAVGQVGIMWDILGVCKLLVGGKVNMQGVMHGAVKESGWHA
jgi:hypothetical protein